MTVWLLLLTEITPKNVAVHNAQQVARLVTSGVAFLNIISCGKNCHISANGNTENSWFKRTEHVTGSSGGGYGSYGYDSRTDNTYSGWGRGNNSYFDGNGDNYADGVDVISRGPRAEGTENQMGDSLEVEESNVTEAVETEDNISVVAPDREQYNQEDFPVDYANAKFFVIKFYGEDDVHKSIKYNVWASTRYGNTKLDAAYHIAQQKPGGCPIFLFFLFVGLAEMIGPVDFKTNVEYWQQQDKWKGSFPLKWHIVKDVPNNLLRHITRENNDYSSPVTQSRDTQEVMLEQGLKIVRIFKEHTSKTCILDDFPFYEGQTEEEGQAGKRGEDPLEIASLLL
ncbi:hypothetical protein Bca52824_018806 [Brassica carinata]|uniref:YTH domain-containing family protein n=1 Tax=Brassica carinata TaxID=52824 RepID=A0A8X8AWR2_BRACI|nr:hypothetical protein Bca52824_018806 [Brassica carinata]